MTGSSPPPPLYIRVLPVAGGQMEASCHLPDSPKAGLHNRVQEGLQFSSARDETQRLTHARLSYVPNPQGRMF